MSILRALARLLDPEAGPEIERLAENLPREDVRRAILGLRELLDLIVSLTPVEAAVAAAIEDLQHREAVLAEREAKLVKREPRARHSATRANAARQPLKICATPRDLPSGARPCGCAAIREMLRAPLVGDRNLVAFLNRNAAP
jgi:hypothetical protein